MPVFRTTFSIKPILALCLVAAALAPLPASAVVINRGVEAFPLQEARPAPKSIYPDQVLITSQPSPSEVDPSFLGPVLLMKSALVDLEDLGRQRRQVALLQAGIERGGILPDETDVVHG